MKQSVEDEISQMEELQRHISERKKLEQVPRKQRFKPDLTPVLLAPTTRNPYCWQKTRQKP
eukprot:2787683-Amphidinium_carterae.1